MDDVADAVALAVGGDAASKMFPAAAQTRQEPLGPDAAFVFPLFPEAFIRPP